MNASPRVLVVEDETPMRRFLRASLVAEGHVVIEAATLAEARMLMPSHQPDVLILDLGLPDGDGLEFVREVREWSSVPIIVVSARGREADKVKALDEGADDYLTKPFGIQELLARIRVAMRRNTAGTALESNLVLDDLVLDFGRRELRRGGEVIHLTPIEWKLLVYLAKNLGRVSTHQQILKEVWGPGHLEHVHYVRVHMAELRKKVEVDPARPRWLVTEAGVGYRLREPIQTSKP
jgi:two-component system KDP operon response regulator KdpE